jgi:hypothetical protein
MDSIVEKPKIRHTTLAHFDAFWIEILFTKIHLGIISEKGKWQLSHSNSFSFFVDLLIILFCRAFRFRPFRHICTALHATTERWKRIFLIKENVKNFISLFLPFARSNLADIATFHLKLLNVEWAMNHFLIFLSLFGSILNTNFKFVIVVCKIIFLLYLVVICLSRYFPAKKQILFKK